jgi:MFS family permease
MMKNTAGRLSSLIPEVLRSSPDYRLAFAGSFASSIGTAMSAIAFPLLVLGLGGSAVQSGSVASVSLGTRLAFRIPAGALVDRWSRRAVMLSADLVRAAALASIPAAAAAGVLHFPQLIAVAVGEGLATALFGPAASTLIRDLAEGDRLTEALGLDQSAQAAAYLVGPGIGGALYAADRMLPFSADAASYFFSALLLWRVTARTAPAERPGAQDRGVTAGIRWLLAERTLFGTLLYAGVINLIASAIEVMIVIDLRARGEPGGRIGLILSCSGVGAILGSLLAPHLIKRFSVPAILLGLGVSWTGVLTVFGFYFSPWVTGALLVLLMALSPAAGVVVGQALFGRTPRHLIGRVSAATSVLLSGLSALGPLTAGASLQAFGPAHSWLTLAAVGAVVTGAGWVPLQAARSLKPAADAADVPHTQEPIPEEADASMEELFDVEDLYDVVAHQQPAVVAGAGRDGVAPAADAQVQAHAQVPMPRVAADPLAAFQALARRQRSS